MSRKSIVCFVAMLTLLHMPDLRGCQADKEPLSQVSQSLESLWPTTGTQEYTVEESSHWIDHRPDGGQSPNQSKLRYKVRVCGDVAHVVVIEFNEAAIPTTRCEYLEKGTDTLQFTAPLSSNKSLLKAARDQGSAYRFAGRSRLHLIAGMIGSVREPRLSHFLLLNRDHLRLHRELDGDVTIQCTEEDGTDWSFGFDLDADEAFFPSLVSQHTTYTSGLHRSYSCKMTAMVMKRDTNEWPYLAALEAHWRSEMSDGFVRDATTRYEISEYVYHADMLAELSFTSEPPDGLKVKVLNSDWLHHEWRDGKVVQVTDPDAMKQLAEFEFGNEGIAWRKWLLMAGSLGLVAGAVWLYRRKSAAVVLLAVMAGASDATANENGGLGNGTDASGRRPLFVAVNEGIVDASGFNRVVRQRDRAGLHNCVSAAGSGSGDPRK